MHLRVHFLDLYMTLNRHHTFDSKRRIIRIQFNCYFCGNLCTPYTFSKVTNGYETARSYKCTLCSRIHYLER